MDLTTIEENLRKLISLEPEEQFKIGRCLTSKEIEDFEKAHKIILPKDYVEFVTKIGSFGFGPNYGLIFLSDYNSWPFRDIENDLSKPFPFTRKQKDEALYGMDYDSLLNGAIFISDYGCGDFDILIVNGEEYGNVWGDYRVSCNGMMPLPIHRKNEDERLTFLEWYNQFLLKKIENIKSSNANILDLDNYELEKSNSNDNILIINTRKLFNLLKGLFR